MNAFFEPHQNKSSSATAASTAFFVNGCIQPFLDGARAQGFFRVYRKIDPVSQGLRP